MATASALAPLPVVPVTAEGITCGLCTSSIGWEVKHADVEDVANCAWLRYERMGIAFTGAPIPAWLA